MNERLSRGTLCQAFALLLLAALGGTAAQFLPPTRIPWREDWSHYVQAKALKEGLSLASIEDAVAIVEAGQHLILDARPESDYLAGRLPGALSLPQTQLLQAYPQVAPLLTPAQPILVYCSGHECDESFELSVYLRRQGFTNLVLFVGGMSEWTAAGKAVER